MGSSLHVTAILIASCAFLAGCGKSGTADQGTSLLLLGAAHGGPGISGQAGAGDNPAGASTTTAELDPSSLALDQNAQSPDFDPTQPLHVLPVPGTGYAAGQFMVALSKQIDCTAMNHGTDGLWHARMNEPAASKFLKIVKINPDGSLKDVTSHGLLLCYTGWVELNPGAEYYGPQQLLLWIAGDPGEFRLDNPSGLEGDGQYLFLISHEIRGLRVDRFQQVDEAVAQLPAGSPYYPMRATVQTKCQAATYAPLTRFGQTWMKDASGERYVSASGPGYIESPLQWPWTTLTMASNLFRRIYVPEWTHLQSYPQPD